MAARSFIFGGNTGITPEDLKRRQAFNQAIMANGADTSPVQGGAVEAVARVLQGALGGYFEGRNTNLANEERAKATEDYTAKIAGALGGGSALAYSPSGPASDNRYTAADAGRPTAPMSTQPGDDNIYADFIDTVKGGVKNPYGLAAVAATGKAESGYSAGNAYRQWSDPSESGQPGQAGGIMSWRAGRLDNLRKFAADNGDDPRRPSAKTQAAFFLSEDPSLIQRLNSAKSVEEAQSLMNSAWAFAGHDRPGGEAGRRLQAAKNYLPGFMGSPQASAAPPVAQQPAPEASLPDTRASVAQAFDQVEARNQQRPVQVASLDPSIGMDSALGYNPRRGMDAPAPVAPQTAAAPAPLPPPQEVAANPTPPPAQSMATQAFNSLPQNVQQAAQADAGFDGFAQTGANVRGAPAAPGAPSQEGIVNDLASMMAGNPGAPGAAAARPTGDVNELVALLSNPWLSEGQQAVVGKLVERQLAQNAPLTPDQQFQREKFKYEKEKDANTMKSWMRLDDNTLYNPVTGETKNVASDPNAAPSDLGLNPQYGVDAAGNPVLLQLGKNGKAIQSSLPEGVTLSKEPIKLDAGTHFVLLDPITRQPVGQIPKDNRGAAAETARGKVEGEAQGGAAASLASVRQQASQIDGQIQSLLDDPNLDSAVGSFDGRIPSFRQGSVDFDKKLERLQGQTFLQARQFLQGQGQITDFESKRAEAAMAQLSTAQSETQFRAALQEFRDAVRSGVQKVEALAGRNGGTPASAPAAPTAAPAPGSYRYNPATGKMEPM